MNPIKNISAGKIASLLKSAFDNGISVFVEEEKLKIKVAEGINLDAGIVNLLKENKKEIISYLQIQQYKDHDKIVPQDRNTFRTIPLSFAQEGLWFVDRLESTIPYHFPVALRCKGALDRNVLTYAINEIVNRHEALRSVFKEEFGIPYQQILAKDQFELRITSLSAQEDKATIDELINSIVITPFDLSADHMLRAHLIRISGEEFILVLVFHHIASDAWSIAVFMRELVELYNAKKQDRLANLENLEIQYADYAIWQREYFTEQLLKEKLAYWEEKLKGVSPLDLPADYPRPDVKSTKGRTLHFTADPALAEKIQLLSHQAGATLFMTLLAAFKVLLYKYTGQADICVGTSLAARKQQEVERLIGFFVNMLPLRSNVTSHISFIELLQQVKTTTLEAYAYQEVPAERIVDRIEKNRSLSGSSLFKVMFILQSAPAMQALDLDGVGVSVESVENITSPFDLAFNVTSIQKHLNIEITYNSDVFSHQTIENMSAHYQRLLTSIVNNPSEQVSKLSMLSAEEERQLLHDFNDTSVAYSRDKTIVDLFEQQVSQTPDRIAVVFEDRQLTYQQLDEKSNQLAHYLRNNYNIKGDDLVGILFDRSENLLIAILAILKAGAGYVPIDAEYPRVRKEHIVQDTAIKALLTQSDYLCDITFYEGPLFAVDIQLDMLDMPAGPLAPICTANHLAYVMYTSGSTGKPRGVMVEHRSVIRLVESSNFISLTDQDVLLSTGAISFDATTFEYWSMLLHGGKLVLCSKQVLLDAAQLAATIRQHGVNIMWFTAGWFNQLVDSDISVFSGLKTVLAGGDKLSVAHVNNLLRHYPGIVVINGYGPTENTTFSLTYTITEPLPSIPIGKPIANSTAYIMDEQQQLCSPGIVGEICVGGDGLARGYLNNEALNREKFIENPYKPGEKLYKTGDLGRWLPGGMIEFIGRKDDQVKIRGYRIEPGEIERVIRDYAGVEAAIVIAKPLTDGGEKELIAYVVGNVEPLGLKEYLEGKLPVYMVPTYYVSIEKIPLTSNGKVDRKALPVPDGSGLNDSANYIAPRNEIEQTVVNIWSEVLGHKPIGVHDNFFSIGGDSMKMVRIASKINTLLQTNARIADIYTYQTIAELALHITKDRTEEASVGYINVMNKLDDLKEKLSTSLPANADIEDVYPVSDIQKGMFFYSLKEVEKALYHDQLVHRISERHFDPFRFKRAFELMVDKHSIFRTGFNLLDFDEPVQIVYKSVPVDYQHGDISYLSKAEQEAYLLRFLEQDRANPFNFATPPLCRIRTFGLGDNRYCYMFLCHHAIIDGWSDASFNVELFSIYRKLETNPDFKPVKLKSSYKDFVIDQLVEKGKENNALYWKNELHDFKRLALPPVSKEQQLSGIVYYTENMGSTFLEELKSAAIKLNTNVQHLCFTAYTFMLSMLSYEKDFVVGLVSNNRPVCEDGDKILGCFLNTIPVRVKMSAGLSWKEYVEYIHGKLIEVRNHNKFPLFDIVRLIGEKTSERNPLFDSMFNYVDFHVYQNPTLTKQEVFVKEELPGLQSVIKTNTFLNVTVSATMGNFSAAIEYDQGIIDVSLARKLGYYFVTTLEQIVSNAAETIESTNILLPAERHQLLYAFNNTAVDYPKDKTIAILFEEQAAQTPDSVALVFEDRQLTYRQLNGISNQFAHYLRTNYNIQAGDILAVSLQRSEWLVITMMALLKAGVAYLPIDPEYPEQRIDYILADSQCKVLIDHKELENFQQQKDHPDGNPTSINSSGDLACIIYTSGSTGGPKGCMLEHKGVVNHLFSKINLLQLDASSVICHSSQLHFVGGIWQLWAPLIVGAKVVLCNNEELKDMTQLLRKAALHEARVLEVIPSQLNEWLLAESSINLHHLHKLILTGEKLSPHFVNQCYQGNRHLQIINTYGQTECSDVTTFYNIPQNADSKILIGTPIQNTQIYIVTDGVGLCPIGVVGEICTSGDGVGRGYLNQATLTAQKFVPNPFQAGGKMYKTGDLGRWLQDGTIEILGRKDEQVSLRGYRIEVEEIEQALLQSGTIEQAVVLLQQSNEEDKRLVAYLVGQEKLQVSAVRNYLGQKLPDYMLPAQYIQLEQFPLLANGKIDKKALLQLDAEGVALGREYVAPRNQLEQQLVGIWQDLLQIDNVGIYNSFFELGGHSLLLLRLVNKINKAVAQSSLRVLDVMQHPTVAQLAAFIDSNQAAPSNPHIITLRKGNDGFATFIIPGMPGVSDGYEQLAQNIPGSGAVLGLQMKGSMGEEEPLTSIEEMAAHNVALIQSMDDVRKISLYAHSYGGTVVYEMLRQLKQTDIEVMDIVLIDSYPFRHIVKRGKESLGSFIKSFLLNTGADDVEMDKRIEQDALKHLEKLMEQSLSVNYEGKEPLDYNIHLVIAEHGLEDQDLQQRGEWKKYFQHVNIITAAGDHFSVVKEPYCSKWISSIGNKTKALHLYSETDY